MSAVVNSPVVRLATEADLPELRTTMTLSIDRLQSDFLSPEAVAASHAVMGLDTQLIADRTYFVVVVNRQIAGCGGWSRRAMLYGGDTASALRDVRLLDPATEPARIRAMYTHPEWVRRGIGRLVLATCEAAARDAGFGDAELMATLAGEPLYRACGYVEVERVGAGSGVATVPLIRMRKSLGR